MRTREFNKVKPYCYILTRLSDGKKYHGVRWANVKIRKSPIEDFGKKYFTSEKSLKKEFKKNPKNFKFNFTYTFSSKSEAVNYETKTNKKLIKNEKWLNKQAFPAIINLVHPLKGKEVSDLRRKRISEGNKKYQKKYGVSESTRKKISKAHKGRKITDKKVLLKFSKAKKGKNNPWYGKKLSKEHVAKLIKARTGSKRSEETKKKMSLTAMGHKVSKKVRKILSKKAKGRKHSLKTKKEMSRNRKGSKHPFYGKKLSKSHVKNISKGLKGHIPWNKGKKNIYSKSTLKRMSIAAKKRSILKVKNN